MGRIVNVDSTGKQRNQLRRTIAEILRRLSQKQSIDDEAKDMIAMIVYCLEEIDEGIDSSAQAWEKRDYWMKAEAFRSEWNWVNHLADELKAVVQKNDWDNLPQMILKLVPHFGDIQIKKLTRDPDLWQGAYDRLMAELEH